MLKFENTKVYNMDNALRGMRNPLDSWHRIDSYFDDNGNFHIGKNDLDLAQRLISSGSEHRKFMRQIIVSTDIIAPRFWWSEFDTYKVGTVASSCSTMHKLTAYPFTRDMFVIEENLDKGDEEHWNNTLNYLEKLRNKYKETSDSNEKKKIFRKMKESLPEGFIQKRTVTLNYETIYTMRHQRKNHRLSEWSRDFMNETNKLPYSKEFFDFEFYNDCCEEDIK